MKPVRLSKRRGEYYRDFSAAYELCSKAVCTSDECSQMIVLWKDKKRKAKRRELDKRKHSKRQPNARDQRNMAALTACRRAGKPVSEWRTFLAQ